MSPSSEDAKEASISRRQRQQLKQEAKAAEERRQIWRKRLRRGSRIGLVVVVVAGVLGGLGAWLGTRKVLPPTTMANHAELSPRAHILTEPMRAEIQKHMLEHADGSGPPGVIIQYNCKKFSCPADLVPNLTRIAEAYPKFVYLAPNPTMDAKIALTRLNEILVLEEYDPARIRQFIARQPRS